MSGEQPDHSNDKATYHDPELLLQDALELDAAALDQEAAGHKPAIDQQREKDNEVNRQIRMRDAATADPVVMEMVHAMKSHPWTQEHLESCIVTAQGKLRRLGHAAAYSHEDLMFVAKLIQDGKL